MSTLSQSRPVGGEIIAVYYAGRNLAAAALGAINASAERARVGTSVAHDKLKHKKQTKKVMLDSNASHERLVGHLRQT